jgi:hypothetical protein
MVTEGLKRDLDRMIYKSMEIHLFTIFLSFFFVTMK